MFVNCVGCTESGLLLVIVFNGDYCEHCNEPLGSINCGLFWVAELLLASPEELCIMELLFLILHGLRLGPSVKGKNADWVCMRTKNWGEYLDIRKKN